MATPTPSHLKLVVFANPPDDLIFSLSAIIIAWKMSTKTENGKIRNKLNFEEIGSDYPIKRRK